jgi:hypothetical protein
MEYSGQRSAVFPRFVELSLIKNYLERLTLP